MGDIRNSHKIFVRKRVRMRPLGGPYRMGGIILKHVTEIMHQGMDWIHFAQDRV